MKVLAINCGSSTLKFQLFEMGSEGRGAEQRLARGLIDRIGGQGAVVLVAEGGEEVKESAAVADHGEATGRVLGWLDTSGLLRGGGLEAIGHRVVHGGERFVAPTPIDDEVISAVEELGRLAPLHNAPALAAIRAARGVLGPGLPQVAVFDTAFHSTMPRRASLYAIPPQVAQRHHVRRYGFHGLAHRYMAERYAAIVSPPSPQARLVTLQLGNGCSAAAIAGGRSVDTSMGLTPLEGLMMGTRCGDADPSLAGFIARGEGVAVEEVEGWLNTRSGLLGVSGSSRDMRELLAAERRGDEAASLAVDMFCYRVRKYIGAYIAALGGVEAVVFGGGIGENAPSVRARICAGMEWCGLVLDERRNERAIGSEARVSPDAAAVHAYVVPVDEGLVIARDVVSCLRDRRGAAEDTTMGT